MSALNLIRPDLKSLQGYVPSGDNLACRSHANELPWSPLVFKEISLNHYPKAEAVLRLQAQLAKTYQVEEAELLLTRGSDDGIDFLMRLFLRAGLDSIMQCPPTFPMYAFYARLQQAEVINCPLDSKDGFELSIDRLISLWQPDCKLIMLCRPNNPTGNLLDLAKIAELAAFFRNKAIVVVDEAYIEFSQAQSTGTLLASFDNLVILRTLSKAYGLAGLRLGTIIAQSSVIAAIKNIIPPYCLSSAVLNLAEEALANKAWFQRNIELILNERQKMLSKLQQVSWLNQVYPSAANFILVQSSEACALSQCLAQQKIAVRHFPSSSLLRITVGTAEQNQALLNALNSFKP